MVFYGRKGEVFAPFIDQAIKIDVGMREGKGLRKYELHLVWQ